ncbi:pyroglutamyl-peptidase I family protein [Paracerasibacillus soli]|uniref:pyroglutamyl-peptidase I family protein n=1 Tax=Paracerasibacillus soli TaxID=480284 RepID=UPI00387E0636
MPIKAIVDQLHEKQLPASISNSAGTYLCNHVMYQSLHYTKEHQLNCPTGFIHLPANHTLALTKSMPSWSQEDLHRAVEVIIHSVSECFHDIYHENNNDWKIRKTFIE